MPEAIDIKNPLELRNFKYISEDLPICVEEVPVDTSLIRVISSCFHDDFICARILKGTIVIDIDGNQQLLQKNDFLFINSNHVYSISEVQEPGFIRVMFAKPSTLSNPLLDRKINRMISDVKFSSTIIHPINPLFYADMDAIYDLSRSRPQEFEFKILSHYVNQLRQIYRIYQHTNPEETVNHDANYDALREMMAFIGESYRNEINLDDIAAAGGVSRSKATRLFRSYIQKSPIQHLQEYRLERSVYFLTQTKLSISEIAQSCGFNQQSYFNRLFIRHFGMTPKQMRSDPKYSR